MNQSEQIKNGFLYVALYVMLIVMSIYIPLVIIPAIVLFPLPFLLFAYRYEWQPTAIFTVIAVLLSFILFGDLGLLIAVLGASTGLLIGMTLRRGMGSYEVWTRGALGGIIGFLFIFVYIQLVFQINWEQEIMTFTEETIQMSEKMVESIGFGQMNEDQQKMIEAQMLGFVQIIPALILIVGSVYGFIVQWISYKTINRIHKEERSFSPFRTLRFPAAIIWVYLLALLVTLFETNEASSFLVAVENILVVLGAILVIQGFSFLFYLSYEKKIPRALPILAIVLTVLFPFLFVFIMRFLGVLDVGLDMRKNISDKKN